MNDDGYLIYNNFFVPLREQAQVSFLTTKEEIVFD